MICSIPLLFLPKTLRHARGYGTIPSPFTGNFGMVMTMESLPELVGTVHIILGPYRGNPIALYMRQDGSVCKISPRIYPWNRTVGIGDTPNKAAADFEAKWKETELTDEMYTGPHWEGGIKPEKPKPVPPPKPAAPSVKTETQQQESKPSSPESTSIQDTSTP